MRTNFLNKFFIYITIMSQQQKEIQVFIKTDFACVFLLNGTFAEQALDFNYPANEPLYITVLPLGAHLLPYTAKIFKGKAVENEKLCAVVLRGDKTLIKLLPRYNYVYSPVKTDGNGTGATPPERVFWAVKHKNYAQAKKLLSEELLATIDDDGLEEFFKDYTAIVKDDFSAKHVYGLGEGYFLVNAEGKGSLFYFDVQDGLVDNISSEE